MSRPRRFTLAALGTTAALLALAAPAWAHVTVTAPGATSGGSDQEITFRVPVEKTVDTTALTIQLPTDTPIASVLVAPVPGWTHTQKSAKLAKPITTDDGTITDAVSQITWTAGAGAGLKPGEFGAFTIIAGQLPDAKSLTFKALQTYSDGSVVRWIQVAAAGSTAEPDFPAPVLTLAPASGGDATSGSTSGSTPGGDQPTDVSVTGAPAPASEGSSTTSNTGPVVLSIIALVVAVGALAFAFVRTAKARREP